jgi:hypothetical protein
VAIAKVEKELSIDFLHIMSSKPSLRGLGQEVVEHALSWWRIVCGIAPDSVDTIPTKRPFTCVKTALNVLQKLIHRGTFKLSIYQEISSQVQLNQYFRV